MLLMALGSALHDALILTVQELKLRRVSLNENIFTLKVCGLSTSARDV